MKIVHVKMLTLAFICSASLYLSSCKGKAKDTTATMSDTAALAPAPAPVAPVEISTDAALTKGVADATKDYPGVKADVSDGEITLTGQVERAKLPGLMQTLNTLRPKKINNQLTVK